jgi:hypothetical protein
MSDLCAIRNPLVRSGLTQDGRRKAELATDHFLPDERDLADLVLFGQRFARHMAYYNADNKKAGDWSAFFEADVTASLAAMAKLPVDAFRTFQLDLERWLRAEPGRDPAELSAHAKLGCHLPATLFRIAGAHHARLPNDHPFATAMIQLAGRSLADPLARLVAYYRGATVVPGADNSIFADTPLDMAEFNIAGAPGDSRLRLSSTIAEAVADTPELSALAVPDAVMRQFPQTTWAAFYADIQPDTSPYVDAIGSANQRYEQIYDALSYNLLIAAIERIYQGAVQIQREASGHLAASLEDFAHHTPHYGLWLTFLQLFRHAQGEINKFTGRHLDFYFREVLRLAPRAAEPDKAHLLFELAKGRTSHLLTAGTLFRAGKDGTGAPVSYALENDIVLNTASVAELRALQIDSHGTATQPAETPHAALVVKSRDGLGEVDLSPDDLSWPPFGPQASPTARVGFAIADRKLFLREGERTITIRAELKSPLQDTAIAPRWIVRLTGDEDWFEVTGTAGISTIIDNAFDESSGSSEPESLGPKLPVGPKSWLGRRRGAKTSAKVRARERAKARARQRAGKRAAQRAKAAAHKTPRKFGPRFGGFGRRVRGKPAVELRHIVEITVKLDANDPPVVPLDAKLHGDAHEPGVPVIEVAFDFDAESTPRAFAAMRDLEAERVTLQTKAEGVKNLMVAAGGGIADASKPFAPFGAQPRAGAQLIIGSSEIFSKSISAWRLHVDWEQPYNKDDFFWNNSADDYNVSEEVLTAGRWVSAGTSGTTDIHLDETSAVIELRGPHLIDGEVDQVIENPPLTTKSVSGFMRMRLPLDFGHDAYPGENTRALVALASDATYSPGSNVNTYDSTLSHVRIVGRASFEVRSRLFPEKPPLPREPYDPVLTGLVASYETVREEVDTFTHLHPFGTAGGTPVGRVFPDLPFDGALLIGVRDFAPPARLTLLIQVADGSGDPLKKAPELAFAYLDGDDWVPFDDQDVDDKTGNFVSSGILGLNVPEDADTQHNLLPAGLHWIRIAVPRDADALNRLLSIDAQAARVVFADDGNDPALRHARQRASAPQGPGGGHVRL